MKWTPKFRQKNIKFANEFCTVQGSFLLVWEKFSRCCNTIFVGCGILIQINGKRSCCPAYEFFRKIFGVGGYRQIAVQDTELFVVIFQRLKVEVF